VRQIGGSFSSATSVSRAFLYEDGQLEDLGVLPGYFRSSVTDINTTGDVVGAASSPDGTSFGAFLYRNNTLMGLGPGVANAINASGVVVGTTGNKRAFRYENGSMTDLGNFGDSIRTSAIDINDSGQIVGKSFGAGTLLWQFWFPGGFTYTSARTRCTHFIHTRSHRCYSFSRKSVSA